MYGIYEDNIFSYYYRELKFATLKIPFLNTSTVKPPKDTVPVPWGGGLQEGD